MAPSQLPGAFSECNSRNLLKLALLLTFLMAAQANAQVTIGRSITGSNINTVGGIIPPDSMGAVGPDFYVEFINGRYAVYRKGTGALVMGQSDDAFWSNAGVFPSSLSDPRILYDHRSGRWFASEGEFGGSLGINVAVSASSDPTGAWTGFFFDPNGNLNDFPMLGVNPDAVVITTREFTTGGSSLNSTAIISIPKADLLAPVPTIANRTVFTPVSNNTVGNAPQPVTSFGASLGGRMPLLGVHNTLQNFLIRDDVHNTAGPGVATLSVTGALSANPCGNGPPLASQPDGTSDVASGARHFQSSVFQVGSIIYAVHAANIAGRAGLEWYKVRETDNAVLQTGQIASPSYHYYYPSISANDDGDVVIGFSRSGTPADGFISSFAVVGSTSGGVTTFGTPFVLRAGVANYHVGSPNRWGDYSATTRDPSDPGIFWTTQERVSAVNTWALEHTEIIVPRPNEVRWLAANPGDFNTGANWIGGAVPSSSSHIIFSRNNLPIGPGYTVTGAGAMQGDRLSVRQGRNVLDLGGGVLTLGNTSPATPSVMIAEFDASPQLTLRNGVMNSSHAVLAPGSFSNASMIMSDVTWNSSGDVTLGGTPAASAGTALLTIGSPSAASLSVAGTLKIWNKGMIDYTAGGLSATALDIVGGNIQFGAFGTKVLRTNSLSITGGGKINLANQQMLIDYSNPEASPIANIQALIVSGYAGGAWNGPGIMSTSTDPAHGIGVADTAFTGAAPPIFGGSDLTTVLVRRVRYGDANLDGEVNLNDFNFLAGNFGIGIYWYQGDFNYDGMVNLNDFNLLAANFGLVGSPDGPTPEDWASLAAAVPEPSTSLLLMSGVAAAAMSRRRRTRN